MSEDFVRCANCGNLNIAGTPKCVFCDTDIDENAEVFKEHADDPSVSELPGAPPVVQEATTDYPAMPAMPDIPDVEVADMKKDPTKEEITEPTQLKEYSSGMKFLYMTLIFIAVSILHYLLNLLVAIASYDPTDPNIALSLNIPANLSSILFIRGSSVILCVPFAIIIGYILGKSIRKFTLKKKEIVTWLIYAIFLDIVVNLAIAAVFVFGFNIVDLYFVYLVGAVFIFIIFNIVTLLIPFLIGTHLIYHNIDKIFFPKTYSGN
ncbi:MAG: hypothetical protein KAS47_05100 [Candidatus Heimdallarchaeota archaeon]|nr:hypothetical protein [Candidatus Heimdallarchaeota archaeon]MCK4972491.1 hypothetical protein [Candidatus Heimdallarchaeota archaeon]